VICSVFMTYKVTFVITAIIILNSNNDMIGQSNLTTL